MQQDWEFEDIKLDEQPMCLDFHPQEKVLAIGNINGTIYVYVRLLGAQSKCVSHWFAAQSIVQTVTSLSIDFLF